MDNTVEQWYESLRQLIISIESRDKILKKAKSDLIEMHCIGSSDTLVSVIKNNLE